MAYGADAVTGKGLADGREVEKGHDGTSSVPVQTARDRLERCLWPLNHTSATHLLFQRCSSLVAGWTFPLMRHWGGYGWEGLLFCEGGGAVRQIA